jgi:hypothetical protein
MLNSASEFQHVTRELSARWELADKDEFRARAKRKCEDIDDMLEDPGTAAKRRCKKLWNNMKKSVVLLILA